MIAAPLERPREEAGDLFHSSRPSALAVERLTLTDFRNYGGLRLELDGRLVVLTGPNGAGKTNLLEAVSFLTPGRGLRRARLRDADRRGAGPWAVAARVATPEGPVDLGTGRNPEGETERRVVRIDGETARGPTALAERVGCVWLTPSMDQLLAESAAPRRRFLDRLVFTAEPEHALRVAGYEHALRERGRLLRAGRADPAWLTALEARAARLGVEIAAARRTTVEGLEEAIAGAERDAFPRPGLAVRGRVEAWLADMTGEEAEARFREALVQSRPRDAETGGSSVGPHRSDLVVHDLELDQPAERSSTGRQKALLVAIALAEARLREASGQALPLILLDEVIAHLDRFRREALFAELAALGAQAWLTGTDPELFGRLGRAAQYFSVRDATLSEHDPA